MCHVFPLGMQIHAHIREIMARTIVSLTFVVVVEWWEKIRPSK